MKCIIAYLSKLVAGVKSYVWATAALNMLVLVILLLCSYQVVEAAASLNLNPTAGPPTAQVTVKGTGFSTYEAVDVYFDTEDRCLSATNGSGAFSCTLKVPKEALPGTHWLTAVGRKSGLAAQKSFFVRVNWSQFHYGPSNRGYNPYENVISSDNVANLNEDWIYKAGGWITTSPVVANGVIYVGSDDGKLYALNAKTGAFKWSYTTGDTINSHSPAVANGMVYVGSDDGKLYAIDAASGALKWSYPTGASIPTPPALTEGVVYVGSFDYKLYALNAKTGAFMWSYTTSSFISSSPAVANGVVYVGSDDGNLYALDATTGGLKWSYPMESNIFSSSAAVANGVVYMGSYDGKLYALNAKTGAFIWSYTTGGPIQSTPAVAKGLVYVGSDDGNLYALDATTAAFNWSYTTGSSIYSSPAVANGVVYVGSGDGKIYALDAAIGIFKGSYTSGSSDPVVANGLVYVVSSDGNLHCFSLDPGGVFSHGPTRPDPALLIPDHRLELQDEG